MKEYEPSSASSTLRGFVINSCEELERFLGLADFSSRCFGPFFFAPAGTIRDSSLGSGTGRRTSRKTSRTGRAGLSLTKPRTAIEAKLEAGLRRCWMKQCDAGVPDADMLVSAEIALYMRSVAHEEDTPAATPAGSPTPRQPDGRKPRRADGTVGKYGGVSSKESPSMPRDVSMLRAAHARLEREQRKRVREGKKMLADRKAVANR
eukprot:jgi/Tetstr1/465586/TSEL_010233.t1